MYFVRAAALTASLAPAAGFDVPRCNSVSVCEVEQSPGGRTIKLRRRYSENRDCRYPTTEKKLWPPVSGPGFYSHIENNLMKSEAEKVQCGRGFIGRAGLLHPHQRQLVSSPAGSMANGFSGILMTHCTESEI